jgi:adenosylcobinamide-GDP ribazoletransferase
MPVHPLFIALQFLTRLPLRLSAMPTPQQTGASLPWYPWVGLLIGLPLAVLAGLVASPVHAEVLAALLLLLWVLSSGGLHLDGLADCADGWMCGGDRERTLAVMADPRTGAAASVALVLVLLLKYSALVMLCRAGEWWPLLLAPALARGAVPVLFLTTPYVRPGGLGAALAAHAPRTASWASLLGLVAFALWLQPLSMAMALTAAALLLYGMRALAMRRLGGITGDVAGAAIELCEALMLLCLVWGIQAG